LASLAGLGKGGLTGDKKEGSSQRVQNAPSWEETRSPAATQACNSPDQRLPESPRTPKSGPEELYSPESNKRVHFAPSTKQDEQTLSTPESMPTSGQASRRLAMPPRLQNNGPFVPRGRGPMPSFGYHAAAFRSPPVQHHHPLHSPHAAYHHAPQPWFRSPVMAASMASRMAYPPQRLMQPALAHPENEWVCDFCNVASFSTYEEACVHEGACKIRCANGMARGYGSYGMESPQHYPGLHATSSLMSRSGSGEEDILSSSGSVMPSNSDTWHSGKMSLAMGESDSEWLSELNCFIRGYCVEVFSATEEDVSRSSKRGRIVLNQVGIRCRYCTDVSCKNKAVAAVSFPTSIGGIYESVKRWQRVHLEVCDSVPQEVRNKIDTLANTSVWVPTTRQYWSDSAKAMGLVDTTEGIRFGVDPKEMALRASSEEGMKVPLMQKRGMAPANEQMSSHRPQGQVTMLMDDALVSNTSVDDSSPGFVVFQEDIEMIPPYVYFLMRQAEPCCFTESDRFVARSKGPVGYPGFQCRHCKGHAGLGKYFPVSAKSLSTNSTSQNIHAHLLKCRKCPEGVKNHLVQLKIEKGKSPRLEPGWRKVFFDKVWSRLHG
jgi:hypothetical protein